ncbi:MAG: HIT domain-containing protein [Armatimonadetes bacterium]|nr:HIT domain-containing protein [Armatimonadota bacterium]
MATIFTKILRGEIPGEILYQDDHVFAIRDLDPKAPVHILIITKSEIPGMATVEVAGDHMHIVNAARAIGEQLGLVGGYRLVINQGADAGQSVPHLHAHLLAGRPLTGDFA